MPSEDDLRDTLRAAHRAASARLDEHPDARVRTAVLAEATRGGDARMRLVTTAQPARPYSRVHRWPLSAAALLVVSVLTGLVATRALRDDPERLTAVASSGASSPAPIATAPVTEPALRESESAMAKTEAPRAPAQVAPSRVPSKREAGRDEVRDEVRNESHDMTRRANAPRADEALPSSPRAVVTPSPTPAASDSAPAPAARAKSDAQADALADPGSTAAPLGATTAMRARIGRVAEPATPEAWVDRIVRLRADGDDAEADRELDALRRRYPGFVVPPNALRAAGTR